MGTNDSENKSRWRKLWESPKRRYLLGIPLGGFLMVAVGAVALGAFNGVINYTNTNEFCYGCHVGMDTIVEEYHASGHFNNATGVSATCADCHVPKEPFIDKMWTKVKATKDVYHQLVGTINLENFEENRLRMAEHVWEIMKANDSRECRSCHDPKRWDLALQPKRAQNHHDQERWKERDETCIDCHYGIAHKRPGGMSEPATTSN